jgi:hypothetical protein
MATANDSAKWEAKPDSQSRNRYSAGRMLYLALLNDLSFAVANTNMVGFASPIDTSKK